jgi:hypothetical protein
MALSGAATFRILDPSMGILKASGFSVLFGLINFIIILFLNNTIERDDLLLLPKGKKIITFLEKTHLMKRKIVPIKS